MPDYKTTFLDLYHAETKENDILMAAQFVLEDIYIDTWPYDVIIDEHEKQRNKDAECDRGKSLWRTKLTFWGYRWTYDIITTIKAR